MATLEQIEQALRAADAAGNTEDARKLAQAYAAMRSQAQPRADFGGVSHGGGTVPASVGSVGRELGLGGRAMLEGVGSTLGMVTDPIAYGAGKVLDAVLPRQQTMSGLITGEQPQERRFGTAREGFSSLADTLRLPTPATPSERVGGQVTEALAGGGGLMGLGRHLATRGAGMAQRGIGDLLSSMPKTQIASLVGGSGASGVTRESGGGQGAQTLAGLIGGLSPAAATAAGPATIRGLFRGGEAGRRRMAGNPETGEPGSIADFRSVGAQPSVGQATGNGRTQGLESLLAGGPTSTGVMSRFAERQASDIGAGLGQKADDLSRNASAERAGRSIERGADTFAGNVKATRKALYWQADQFIPAATTLPLSRTWQTLTDLVTPTPGATATTGAMVNQKIAQMAQNVADDLAANGGTMPYEAVRALRTRIGEELAEFSLSPDRPTAQYKRLYGALSDDLEEVARQHGPDASQAMHRANVYTKTSAERLKEIQRVVDKNGGPEKVYRAVMSGTQDGGTTLRAVMQSLPEDGQKAVTAAVIKRMGKATPGQQDATGEVFSSGTFMTNWNNVSKEAKRALFDRHGPKFVADMDKIARVSDRIKQGSKVFANPSGTANRAAAYTYGTGVAGAALATPFAGPLPLLSLVFAGLGGNALARGMTNARFVDWLARSSEMPASALPQQMIVLRQIGEKDPDVAEVAAELEQVGQQ